MKSILTTPFRPITRSKTSHRSSQAVVDILPADTDASVQMMKMTEKPDVTYADIGGMDIQKQEIKEAIELPLTHP